MRSQALDKAARRIVWLRFGGILIAFVLAGRAGHLTVSHTRAQILYDQQIQTEQHLSAARGTIFDRGGRELAITTESASIYAVPSLIEDRSGTAHQIAEILGLDGQALSDRLVGRESFTYIARWVDPEQADAIRALELRGVGIDREPRRTYPAGKLAAPLIGFANIDGQGVRGIEQVEDEWLRGQERDVRVERDARGRALALHSTDPRGVLGGEIMLTLDAAMQGAAEAALQEAMVRHEARGGFVLMMDPKTGDLLTLAEAPGFDPNQFRHLEYSETRARSFTDVVEAGSTMKAFLLASALDAGVIDTESEFDTGEGWMRVRGKTIRDSKPHGLIRTSDILRVSSNVGAVQVAQRLGREAQYRGLLHFGFGDKTGVGFPQESSGIVRDWPRWKPVDQATIAFGQGLSVTAIQLVQAVAALANDGERMRPRLVLARRQGQESWQKTQTKSLGHAVSPEAARRTLDMMQEVVSPRGTGRLAGLEGVSVAGKTGTAQKLDLELGRYSQDRYIAWFIGVVPANDPELAIVVAVDEPMGRLHSGGGVAAPLFAQVAAAGLARRGIATQPAPIPAERPTTELLIATAPSETVADRDGEHATQFVDAEELVEAEERARVDFVQPPLELEARPAIAQRIEAPLLALVAAPPADPVALAATGSTTPNAFADSTSQLEREAVFVPDFSGQTMTRAIGIARGESLILSVIGATDGHVVSQVPVPGTVLDGQDRTVRLEFAPSPQEG